MIDKAKYTAAKQMKKQHEIQYNQYFGKILNWLDLLIVPIEIELLTPFSNPRVMGLKAIIIRAENTTEYKVGQFTTVPLDIIDKLEEFPAILLWGFVQ